MKPSHRRNHPSSTGRHLPPGSSSPRTPVPSPKRAGRGRLLATLALVVVVTVAVIGGLIRRPSSGSPTDRASRSSTRPGRPPTPATNHGETPAADLALAGQINRANELLAAGKVEDAARLYTDALRNHPQDEDLHYNLGIAWNRLGRTNEAQTEFEAALKIYPDYAEVHNNLGNLLLRAGQTSNAVEHLRAAIKAMPDYPSAYNNLGNALRIAGQSEEATRSFAKAVELNTNYWEAHFNLANMYRTQGRNDEAAIHYRAVLQLQPKFEPAQRELSQITSAPNPPLR